MATAQLLDRAIELPGAAGLIDELRAYGRHYKIKRWHERSEDQQVKIYCALKAFRTWRIRQGESFDEQDPWQMAPPDIETLRGYLAMLTLSSVPWQDVSIAALRLYCLHNSQPTLFRMIEITR